MGKKKWQGVNNTDGAVRAIGKLFTSFHRHGTYQVFADFVTMAACSISNAIDRRFFDEREKLYLQAVKRYSKEEVARFPEMLALLVLAFEPVAGEVVYRDVLGELYMSLDLGNEWAGQFFTPYSVTLMMAQMTLGDERSLREQIEARGYVRAMEPAVGGGAMVIATADAFQRFGINYQQHLHFTCVDVDLKAVCMAYIQLSLLHIPAVIVHGNALSGEEWSTWYTPAHLLGLWDAKLHHPNSGVGEGGVVEAVPSPGAGRDRQVLDEPAAGIAAAQGQLTLF